MFENLSKQRQQAEIAFGKTQTDAETRNRARVELDDVISARNEKTSRLRAERLAREEFDRMAGQDGS